MSWRRKGGREPRSSGPNVSVNRNYVMKQTLKMLLCQLSNNFLFSKLGFKNSQTFSATSVKQSLHPQTEEAGRRGGEKET